MTCEKCKYSIKYEPKSLRWDDECEAAYQQERENNSKMLSNSYGRIFCNFWHQQKFTHEIETDKATRFVVCRFMPEFHEKLKTDKCGQYKARKKS